MNKVLLIGRLGKDPELRVTSNGVAVCNFSIAVDRPFTNQKGDRDVDWINVVFWRKQAEICANYLSKGSRIGVEGRLQIRNYETKEGEQRRVAEVVGSNMKFLDYAKNKKQNDYQVEVNNEEDIKVPF